MMELNQSCSNGAKAGVERVSGDTMRVRVKIHAAQNADVSWCVTFEP
ncbi:MAG: hypothetical protein WCP55_21010 [Lentisphaerota bacterium]